MPTYQFNTQRHVRIWFSGYKDVFLNDENQWRMVQFRKKNPRANMTLLYSASMLNAAAQERLKVFCIQQNVSPLDFDTVLLAECVDAIDKALHRIAKTELDAYFTQQGGNLAAASDIARLITPLLTRGTYSDFDTNIEVDELLDIRAIKGPMVLNLGGIMYGNSQENTLINNDMIGIAMIGDKIDPRAYDLLRCLQNCLLVTYHQGAFSALRCLIKSDLAATALTVRYYKTHVFQILMKHSPNISIPSFRLFVDKATQNILGSFRLILREEAFQLTRTLDEALRAKLASALQNVINDDFPDQFTIDEQSIIKTAVIDLIKSEFKIMIERPTTLSPTQTALIDRTYGMIKDIDDPDEVYRIAQSSITSERLSLLKESVTLFSGPAQLLIGLGRYCGTQPSNLAYLSFDKNYLSEHFNSAQSCRFGMKLQASDSTTGISQLGLTCDLSWLASGQASIQKREARLHEAARAIQFMWKNHLDSAMEQSALEKNTRDEALQSTGKRL